MAIVIYVAKGYRKQYRTCQTRVLSVPLHIHTLNRIQAYAWFKKAKLILLLLRIHV